jgi:hypothetical protein
MNSTALILHPTASHARPITRIHPQDNTLETRGPILGNHTVHTRPGHFLATASFEDFVENRERYCVIHPQRRPKEMEAWELEAHAARRIVALVDHTRVRGEITWDQLREIRWRAIISQPQCQESWLDDHLSF